VTEDRELRDILRATAQNASLPTVMPEPMRRKVMLRRARTIGLTFLTTVAIAVGGFQGIRALTFDEAAPTQPARQPGVADPKVEDLTDRNIRDMTPDAPAPEVPYVIDLTTRDMTPLPEAITGSLATGRFYNARFAASPDGSSLTFVGEGDDGRPQIFMAGIDGTGVRQVTHDRRGAFSPAWSPDGSRIAYVGYGSGKVENLFVLDVATGESTQITRDRTHGLFEPQFTPDGSSLVYTDATSLTGDLPPERVELFEGLLSRGCCGSYPVLRTMPVGGGRSTLLFGRGRGGMGDAGGGALSPDGSLVTMMGSAEDGGGALRFLANVDGTELARLSGRGSTPAGTWSPDGTRIVCSATDGARGGILVVDVATGDASRVAEGSGAIWLDDHTLLVDV
jgi:Tol biopolymer transport system component